MRSPAVSKAKFAAYAERKGGRYGKDQGFSLND